MFRMKIFETLEDEALLALVDKYCSESIHNPFESKKKNFDATVINEKVIIDKLIDLHPSTVAPQSVIILDALIYKMSAPYRHAKFWRSTRRVTKELKKLNALKLNKYLRNISNEMLRSEMHYSLNVSAKRFIAGMLISRAIRSCRLRKLCEQAASHCLQHMQTGHLLQPNLLLLALNADVYDALKKDMAKIVECYDCLQPLLTKSSLQHVGRLLIATNNSIQNGANLVSSLSSFRSIASLCDIEESEYIDLYTSTDASVMIKRNSSHSAIQMD